MNDLHTGNTGLSLHLHRHGLALQLAPDEIPAIHGADTHEGSGALAKRSLLARRWTLGFVAVASLGWNLAHATYQPNIAKAVLGSTPAEVHARFTTVIYHNMVNTPHLTNLTDFDWQLLAYTYTRAGGNIYSLDAMIAAYHSGVYAHYKYVTRIKAPFVPPSTGLNATISEIYLDFLTAPYGAATPLSAFLETTVYVTIMLKGSYEVGQTVGSGMAWLISNYDPPLWEAIGANANSIVSYANYIGNASTSGVQGFWEWQMNINVFQVPFDELGSFSAGLGDFGLLDNIDAEDITGNFCMNVTC